MNRNYHHNLHLILPFLLILVFLAGCSAPTATPPVTPTQSPQALTATSTPLQPEPTPTSVPLAAQVNEDGIPLADYQTELGQLQAAQTSLGKTASAQDQRQKVLDDLIDQTLLAQAAYKGGFQISDNDLHARISQLAKKLGGDSALAQWETNQGYTPETFAQSLKRAVAAAWQRDQIFAQVPKKAEQVHARQILVYNKEDADRALNRLIPGIDFATLAYQYDPVTGGDLGWFPKGYLTDPQVETAAFSLQPGQVSPVIEGKVGFHIIQVIERDPERALSADARRTLQEQAFQAWLKSQRDKSQITIIVP